MKRSVSADQLYKVCKGNYLKDVKDIRSQLGEQMRCLDVRLDSHMGMLQELQDFYRRRAEVESEYSRNLDKLVKSIQNKHKQEKIRRDQWPFYSTNNCWQSLLASTRRQSLDHATLSDIYMHQMTTRFQDIMDDMIRIHRKCKEIGAENHEELIKVLNELQSAMKTYHQYHGESIQAENKLRYVETQKAKAEQGSKAGTMSKKAKNMEKQADKKAKKYSDSKQKALVARNEYILSLDTANAAIQRYYCEDLHNLINCIDCGYHNSVERSLMMHVSVDQNLIHSRTDSVKSLNSCIDNLDQRADKQRFLELYNQQFALPKKFEFQPHKGDEVRQISAQKVVQADLLDRLHTLDENIKSNKLETDEIWKTIETVEKSFIELVNQKDYDVTNLFAEEQRPPKSPHEKFKKRSDRMDTEEFYIKKFRDFTIQSNRIARLQAKFNSLQKALGEGGHSGSMPRPPSLPPKPKNARRLGKIPKEGAPKLFGGSIEEYVEATEQEIPMVVRSCVRVINLYGRYHQGIFRVSGSQHEINEFRNAFEKGEDPLLEIMSAKDVNSVAGLLKLYFRELKEPLFPTHLFDELINCSKLNRPNEAMLRVRELIGGLPKPIFIVGRYLFAFLSHLSEYSDENMMDAYNLAICFGPTLLPIPPDRDQVQFQNYVIDLVKHIILQHEVIFPKEIEGALYEKIVIEEEDGEGQDSLDNLSDEDIDEIGDNVSEDEPDTLEAIAQYDFQGRTQRELSFKKGDVLEVYEQVSPDWWRGSMRGTKGLIPTKYIAVRTLREREEERLHSSSSSDLPASAQLQQQQREAKRKSAESLPARPAGLNTNPNKTDGISTSQPNISALSIATTAAAIQEQSVIGTNRGLSPHSTDGSSGGLATQGSQRVRQISPHQMQAVVPPPQNDISPTQERVMAASMNLAMTMSLTRDASSFRKDPNASEWHHVEPPMNRSGSKMAARDRDPDRSRDQSQDSSYSSRDHSYDRSRDQNVEESPRGRSQTPVAPSPLHSGQVSPAIRSDVILETDLDYPNSSFKPEALHLKDATLTSSYTEYQDTTESLLSDLNKSLTNKDSESSSMSRETLLSKDSGFSQMTSSSRETTPSGDDSFMQKSDSRDPLEESGIEDTEERSSPDSSPNNSSSQKQSPMVQDTDNAIPEWHHDIDDALAEIMHDVESLEKQQHLDKLRSLKPQATAAIPALAGAVGAKDTPDLVIGLPVGQNTPSPAASPKGKASIIEAQPVQTHAMSTAEVFANSNQSTIKKGSHVQIPKSHAQLETSASAGSVPLAFKTQAAQVSSDEVVLMRRTASTTAALRSRNRKNPPQPRLPRHNSDPQAEEFAASGRFPETPVSVEQHRTVQVLKPPTPSRGVIGYTNSPGDSNSESGRKPPLMTPIASPSTTHQTTTPTQSPHDQITPRGPKPPIKMKPPVMKKPVKSPDVLKKLKEAQENNAQVTTPP